MNKAKASKNIFLLLFSINLFFLPITILAVAITGEPINSTICSGGNTSFTVTATGTSLTYQWEVKPPAGVWANVTDGGVYSGATTTTLTLTGATVSLNGYTYRCTVNGDPPAPTQTSDEVILTVNSNSAVSVSIGSDITSGTTNVATGGTASASASYAGNPPADAFDGNTSTKGWGNNNSLPSWLQYDLGTGNEKIVTSYKIYNSGSQVGGWNSESYNPKTWKFQGYDGSSWVDLDNQSNGNLTLNQWKQFSFSNTIAYQKYRIYITASEGANWTFITELRFYIPKDTICQGTNVIFTATPTNGGAGPIYQWKLNNVDVGTNSTTYSNSGLVDGDKVKCVLTSNVTCPTGNPATSTVTTVTVNATSVVGSIAADNTSICLGSSSGTFTISGYTGNITKWQKRVNAGSWSDISNTANTYSETPVSAGTWDYRAVVVNGECSADYSSTASLVVTTSPVSVSVASDITSGTTNVATGGTASASASYGVNPPADAFDGNTSTKGWGNNNSLPSWLQYDLGSGNEKVVTSYKIYNSSSQVGGWNSESYNPKTWKFQGYDGSSWVDLDIQSDGNLTLNQWKEFSFSNTIAYQQYRIYITASESGSWALITELQLYEQKNTICQGTNVTFTATPTNGGAGPTYQWMLNDVNVGTNSTTYSTSGLADGDNVKCVLTSNAVCPTGNPATSTVTTVTVNVAPVGGSITGGSTICYGNTTETLTLSGKTGTVFKWQKRVDAGSWTDINNTADTYSEIPTSGGAWDYRVTVKSGVCPAANSSIVSVTVGKITGLVTANTTSNCTINSADETQWVYFSDNGNLICAVKDASGGGSMGASTAKVYIDGSVQSYNNNPYLQRIISITPTGGVPAKVRIYFTNTELTALKATRGEYASRTYTDLYVTKFSGDISAPTGSGISITPTAYLNNASVKAIHGIRPEWNNIYAVEFDVTSFSTFFLHFNPSPLPVELLQFKAECLDKGILLKWATASETNNNYFTLEKSSDAIYFNTIDTVEGAGNSHQTKEYSFIDKKQLYDGNIYYRLKQTDRDGKFKYSDIIASNCKEVLKDIIISPNPVNNELSIKIANNKTSLYFEIIGSNGAVVYKGSVTEKTTIPTNSFSSGVYLIKFENGNSLKFSKKD